MIAENFAQTKMKAACRLVTVGELTAWLKEFIDTGANKDLVRMAIFRTLEGVYR